MSILFFINFREESKQLLAQWAEEGEKEEEEIEIEEQQVEEEMSHVEEEQD